MGKREMVRIATFLKERKGRYKPDDKRYNIFGQAQNGGDAVTRTLSGNKGLLAKYAAFGNPPRSLKIHPGEYP
jgi:hypothetical protein